MQHGLAAVLHQRLCATSRPTCALQAAQEQAERMVASLNGRVQQLESQLLAAQRQAHQQAQQTGPTSVTHEVKVC